MKKYKKTIVILLTIFIFSCNKGKVKTINIGNYQIDIPSDWKEINQRGIDSYLGVIITAKGDTITSDFGENTEKFDETNKVFSRKQFLKYKEMGMDTENLFWSYTPEIDQAQGTFLNEFYMYIIIDKHKSKLRIPKNEGKGFTGISIDSVKKSKNRLTIIGENLNKTESDLLVNSFKTIKFNDK